MGLFILFAPFLVGFALCISDGNADLPQHLLVDLADRCSQRSDGCRSIEIKDRHEIFVVEVAFRFQSTAGHQSISDTDGGCCLELYSDVKLIIFLQTTTIKLILNMLKRTGGTVKVMGLDNIAEEQKVKSELGVVFDTNYFSDDWKVSQVEKSISVFYPNWDSQKFADMLRKFHIAPTKKVKELSKGMQMKLMLACAFSYNAKLLILDEPTSGLDPVSRDELLKNLSEYIEDGEHSVLFSTHITGDLERAADYITYISYGELFFTGSKDDFVDMFRIVKGGIEELSDDLKNKAAGIRTFPTGFEALMKTEDISGFPNLTVEPATIDEIVVFTSKKGDDYE